MADSKNVLQATDENFEADVLKSEDVSLVDFWAEWCGPCRALGPTIESIAEGFSGKAKVYKMNVDENPNTPGQYSVRSIPTVIVFKGGQAVEQLVGNQPKEAYEEALNKHL